jgi:hypothetical protein
MMFSHGYESWSVLAEEAARRGQPPPKLPNVGSMYRVAVALYVAIFVVGTALLLRWLFDFVRVHWLQIPELVQPLRNRTLCAVTVVGLGALMYALRSRRRLEYACIELAAAAATAFDTLTHLRQPADAAHSLLAILGSTYVAVRGWDNLATWRARRKALEAQP